MKKLFSALLLLILVFLLAPTTFAQSNLKGDIDINNKVDASDARLTLRAAVGLEEISSDKLVYADMDNDNSITASDARLILRTSVGLEEQKYVNSNPIDNEIDKITFTEAVVVDNKDCTIKITDIDPDNLWGYTLKTFIHNKSSEITYMIAVESAAINGVQCDPFFATEVAPGKKANVEISFSDEILEAEDITSYTDIELTFRVYDTNDWSSDDIVYQTIHIYPYGEINAVNFVRTPQPNDTIIIDNEYTTVIVTGYEYDEIWGYTAKLFLLNKTNKNLMYSFDNVSVNGFMADPFYATSVLPGKCAFSSVYWSETIFAQNGITKVNEIDFMLSIYDYDNWLSDYLVNEKIVLNP